MDLKDTIGERIVRIEEGFRLAEIYLENGTVIQFAGEGDVIVWKDSRGH